MHVYACNPIDWWQWWLSEDELVERRPAEQIKDYLRDLKLAQEAAFQIGWEGDVREGPFVCGLPGPSGACDFIIAWKQDNNGTTFVASRERLPWMEEHAMSVAVSGAHATEVFDVGHDGKLTPRKPLRLVSN